MLNLNLLSIVFSGVLAGDLKPAVPTLEAVPAEQLRRQADAFGDRGRLGSDPYARHRRFWRRLPVQVMRAENSEAKAVAGRRKI